MRVELMLKGWQVLAWKDSESFYISNVHSIALFSLKTNSYTITCYFPKTALSRISSINNAIRRLLRADIRFAFRIDSGYLIFVRVGKFYKLDERDNSVTELFDLPSGSRPLNFTKISIENFDEGVYFGEYFSNAEKGPVRIYKFECSGLTEVYQFPSGELNHIHNLIEDPYRKCIWILAGDFGMSAAIYRADNNFKNVERVKFGSQLYRSCVAFPCSEGLLYATDSQFETNFICVLREKNGVHTHEKIGMLNGPSIFGTQWKDKYVFSTSVEAINDGNIIQRYLRRKRGPGIKENFSEIKLGTIAEGFKSCYTNEKDILPFILFQFGNIFFPTGVNESEKLVFTNIALKKNDFSTLIFTE
jgi:hypothetical protein